VCVRDLKTSKMRWPRPELGCATEEGVYSNEATQSYEMTVSALQRSIFVPVSRKNQFAFQADGLKRRQRMAVTVQMITLLFIFRIYRVGLQEALS